MEFTDDAKDFISLLNKHGVEYLIIGGWAVIAYGYSRYTADLDVYYRKNEENAKKLFDAITEFFGVPPGLTGPEDLLATEFVQYGLPPNRIDITNFAKGITFDEALAGAGIFPKIEGARMISLDALIKNKCAVDRDKDRQDVIKLEKIRAARQSRS